MQKNKLFLPLFAIVPMLFSCNQRGLDGDYKINTDSATSHLEESVEFLRGKREDYVKDAADDKQIFLSYKAMKEKIVNVLKLSGEKREQSTDNQIKLSKNLGVETVRNRDNEEVKNVKCVNEIDGKPAYYYGQDKTGYHFYDYHVGSDFCYVENLVVCHVTANEGNADWRLLINDAGFKNEGDQLKIKMKIAIDKINEGKFEPQYRMIFNLSAKR